MSSSPDGVLHLVAPVPGTATRSLAMSGYGFTRDELVSLFQFVSVEEDHPQLEDDRLVIRDPNAVRGLDRIASGPTRDDLLQDHLDGRSTTTTWYRTDDSTHDFVVLTADAEAQASPLRDLLVSPLAVDPTVTGLPADLLVGTVAFVGGDQAVLARWDDGGTEVTVYSTLSPPEVIEQIPKLHAVTPAEWSAIKDRTRQTTSPSAIDGTSAIIDHEIEIGAGSLGSGRAWGAELGPPSRLTLAFAGGASTSFGVSPDVPLDLWASETWSVAIALLGPDPVAQTMRIRTPDATIVDLPLLEVAVLDPTSSFTGRAAAFAFDQVGPVTVELLDSHGRVVDRLRTPGFDT
jgi:hypothetical protein